MSAAVLGILGLSTVQIAGIAIAAGLLVILIIVLVVRSSRGGAEESAELAPPESTAPSFLDEAPRDDLDRLGRRDVVADEEEVGATTGDLAEERNLDWGPTDEAVPLSEPMGPDDLGGEDAPAELTSPEPAPAEAAPDAEGEPAEETAEAEPQAEATEAGPPAEEAAEVAAEEQATPTAASDETAEPAEAPTAETAEAPAESTEEAAPQEAESEVAAPAEEAAPEAAAEEPATEEAAPAEGLAEAAAPEEEPAAEEAAPQESAEPEAASAKRLVPLSDIIVTTSHKMVDLEDADVRRMLKDLVTYEIDQAAQYKQLGQNLDAVLQLTEAEKICHALGLTTHASQIREMMKELQT